MSWQDHRYGGGSTLHLAIGLEGHVNWSSTRGVGYVATVPGFKDKVFGSNPHAARRWVERALRKKLAAALSALDAVTTVAESE